MLGAIDDTCDDGLNAHEATAVELNDARVYFNTRNQNGSVTATRGEAFSSDGGRSFDRPSEAWSGSRRVRTF
jgi:sialidase-1